MIRLCPRFSLRTLSILVTLVCLYFGAWEATKKWGMPLDLPYAANADGAGNLLYRLSARTWTHGERSPLPLVISRDEGGPYSKPARHYYVWLFGPTFRLPFESAP